jgi:hypothetical protein
MKSFLLVGVVLLTPAWASAQTIACDTSNDCGASAHCIAGACRSIEEAQAPITVKPYGAQILLADGIAAGMLGTGALFSGPIVHLAHKRPVTALESFGLRVFGISLSAGTGVLVAMALPAQSFEGEGCMRCGPSPNLLPQMFAGMMIGAGIGWIVSSVIDAVFLARPPKPAAISSAAR